MQPVNYEIFGSFFGCLGSAEHTAGKPFGIDGNDEARIKELFRTHLVPAFSKMLPENRARTYWTFRYYLTTRSAPITAIRDSVQDLSLEMPTDEWEFIRWIWEVLWAGEDYHLGDLSGIVERPDVAEAGLIFAYPRGYWGNEDEETEEARRGADRARAKYLREAPVPPAESCWIVSGQSGDNQGPQGPTGNSCAPQRPGPHK
jgi:hypothetical protein